MNARPHVFISATLSISLLYPLYFSKTLNAQDTYHVFTDKKGQNIEAILMLVTPDKSKASVRHKNGRNFDIPILTLSLDDQQFIKNWLKQNPIKMDFNLDITFVKSISKPDKVPIPKYELEFITKNTLFKIEIKNRSRVKLTGATLEYYIFTEHSVGRGDLNSPDAGLNWWFYPHDYFTRNRNNGQTETTEKPITLSYGKAQIEDLKSNYSTKILTDSVPIRELINKRSRTKLKDTLLGVIVRVTDENGNELGLPRSFGQKLLKLSWEEISKMPPGDPSGLAPRRQNN